MTPPTNRADAVRNVLIWEQVRDAANARAAEYRRMLNADAVAEYEEQGTVPTWRMPDIATVSLPVSREKAVVADETALLEWVKRQYPTEVETKVRVRPGFLSVVDTKVVIDDGTVVDPETGELVPGMSVREGGIPGTLRILAADAVKPVVAQHAADMVAALDGAFNEPRGES